jgi:hypothetical protein
VSALRHDRPDALKRRRRLILALAWMQVGAVGGAVAVVRKLAGRAA